MNARLILFFILGIDALVLIFQSSELSISYGEALLLFGDFSFLQAIIKTSIYFLGQNDLALRLPMIILHLLSATLLYKISKKYLKKLSSRVWITLIFILLPGVISSALIVNSAGLVIFGLFLFVYLYENYPIKYIYPLLLVYSLASGGFVYLFLALIFFSIFTKNRLFFIYNLSLFALSIYLYAIDLHGSPSGHFLDLLGIYAAIFTPIIFVYLFYVLYRKYLTKDISILWFISSTALIVSLLLSFRQRLDIGLFAPYLILALPLVAQTFEHSYRVRLRVFRKNYRFIFFLALALLLVNSSVVFFNKYLYNFVDFPKKHFAYSMHVAKELAKELKKRDIDCVSTTKKMSLRLEFYGVTKCNEYKLEENSLSNKKRSDVTIRYKNRVVYAADVTKINKNQSN